MMLKIWIMSRHIYVSVYIFVHKYSDMCVSVYIYLLEKNRVYVYDKLVCGFSHVS